MALLSDASPVDSSVCGHRGWRRSSDDLTNPGEQAASALAAIGARAFDPLLAGLRQPVWVGRRNAAWALGVLDDPRAVNPLTEVTRDSEVGAIGRSIILP
jgi:HEAT repeat protein